ncbi:MAG TPA: hypothetical protein VEK09_07545, partial [Jatrophihabitantaceae bacterium]|nr:hypothetical protein [Jatrophihabitantaceae bacterium]
MLFDMIFSYSTLATIFDRRLSLLEEICLPLPPAGTPLTGPLFDRLVRSGEPEIVEMPEPHPVTLGDGSTTTVDGVRLHITQKVDVFVALLNEAGLTKVQVPGGASLILSMSMRVADGNAQMCVTYEDVTLPDGVPQDLVDFARDTLPSLVGTTCVPIPVGDMLSELVAELPIQGGAVFDSTDVLNAGLAPAPGAPLSLTIHIEMDTVDPDAAQRWADFHRGIDVPHIVTLAEAAGVATDSAGWALTVDKRLFDRIFRSMVPAIEEASYHTAQPGHLDLYTPTTRWSPSRDLWGYQQKSTTFPFMIDKKLVATGLPTLLVTINGTAVDACPGLLGRVNIAFTVDLALAFAIPQPDMLRLYVKVHTDIDDSDEFWCIFNLAVTFSAYFAVLGVFGVMIGTFVAIVVASMAAESAGKIPLSQTCYTQDFLQVCDMPWRTQSPLGQLHLAGATGVPAGLVLVGSLVPATPGYRAPLAVKVVWPFTWLPPMGSCDPISGPDDLYCEARIATGARVCDVRVLDHTDAYAADFTPGNTGIVIRCLMPGSQAPTDPCPLLIATTQGLALFSVPPPPPVTDEVIAAAKVAQQIGCRDIREGRSFRRDPDPVEIDLALVSAVLGGLERGQRFQLRADDRLIASGLAGRLGVATASAVLTADSRAAELSIVVEGHRPATRRVDGGASGRATLELWRRT